MESHGLRILKDKIKIFDVYPVNWIRFQRNFSLLTIALLHLSCASIMNHDNNVVGFDSIPEGSTISVPSGKQTCKTPCTLEVDIANAIGLVKAL